MSARTRVAESLRMLRARNGVSQTELADAIGVNKSTLSSWERYGCLKLLDAVKLAEYYGVTLDELSGRKPIS